MTEYASARARTRRARLRARLSHISLRDALLVGIPVLALVVAAFWYTAQFIRPAPPGALVLSSGSPGGAYEMFAARYAPIMARNGVELHVRSSAGAWENLQRLKDPAEEVDAGFVQGGLARGDDTPN
ncbi:MAG TPA: C4-dicarboxylate ABC transporter substrate-binding protein, partial [Burkholderiales bacterium]|nr:C4-dicarboxylate ABC transporter substrate-binding protein [Burkholderiales bacterium]